MFRLELRFRSLSKRHADSPLAVAKRNPFHARLKVTQADGLYSGGKQETLQARDSFGARLKAPYLADSVQQKKVPPKGRAGPTGGCAQFDSDLSASNRLPPPPPGSVGARTSTAIERPNSYLLSWTLEQEGGGGQDDRILLASLVLCNTLALDRPRQRRASSNWRLTRLTRVEEGTHSGRAPLNLFKPGLCLEPSTRASGAMVMVSSSRSEALEIVW